MKLLLTVSEMGDPNKPFPTVKNSECDKDDKK